MNTEEQILDMKRGFDSLQTVQYAKNHSEGIWKVFTDLFDLGLGFVMVLVVFFIALFVACAVFNLSMEIFLEIKGWLVDKIKEIKDA